MILYAYKVVREDINGNRGKRAKRLVRYGNEPPLRIGGLYTHLGRGYPGMQRVLSMDIEEYHDPPEEGEEQVQKAYYECIRKGDTYENKRYEPLQGKGQGGGGCIQS